MTATFPTVRMRRLRQHPKVRDLVRETELSVNDLICPIFIKHGQGENTPVSSMPGQYQVHLDKLTEEIDLITSLKIPAVLLFGIPKEKDAIGSEGFNEQGIIIQAIGIIKKHAPALLIISDVCLCEYTDHGHCGVVDDHTGCLDVNNDETLALLQKQAIAHVKAGADIIAPSGSIDGMVQAIRTALDDNDFKHIPILSYSMKYASALYGPFREAAEGTPQFGDRRSYQADPAHSNEALREAQLDIAEGADMLMVKPALAYLDIISRLKSAFPGLPMCAYQVSGEYSMIKAASEKGWLDEQRVMLETLVSIKRAGADMIITYFAKDVATLFAK